MTNYATQNDINAILEALDGDEMNQQRLCSLVSDVGNWTHTAKHWERQYIRISDTLTDIHTEILAMEREFGEAEEAPINHPQKLYDTIHELRHAIENLAAASVCSRANRDRKTVTEIQKRVSELLERDDNEDAGNDEAWGLLHEIREMVQ